MLKLILYKDYFEGKNIAGLICSSLITCKKGLELKEMKLKSNQSSQQNEH